MVIEGGKLPADLVALGHTEVGVKREGLLPVLPCAIGLAGAPQDGGDGRMRAGQRVRVCGLTRQSQRGAVSLQGLVRPSGGVQGITEIKERPDLCLSLAQVMAEGESMP